MSNPAYISGMRIRWANIGVQIDGANGGFVTDCHFEQSQTGVYSANCGAQGIVVDGTVCDVQTPYGSTGGCISGTLLDVCPGSTDPHVSANFAGLGQAEGGAGDDGGAVGPNYFVAVQNQQVAVYDKITGQRLTPPTSLGQFLTVVVPDGPFAGTHQATADPRVLYDPRSQRWIACGLAQEYNSPWNVVLGVSLGSDPVGNGGDNWVADNWTNYLVPFNLTAIDQPRLGVDDNGIYIAVSNPTYIAAIPKAGYLDHTAPPVVDAQLYITANTSVNAVVPAQNFDAAGSKDPEWLLADTSLNGTISVAAITWSGSPPLPTVGAWVPLQISGTSGVTGGHAAPQLGWPYGIKLGDEAFHLGRPLARHIQGDQFLWTCHGIYVNAAGNDNDGQADRAAVEWFVIETSSAPMQMVGTRIWDSAAADPMFYYFPSIAVNTHGDVVVGYGGSSSSSYISAYYSAYGGTSGLVGAPTKLFGGTDYLYGGGDYNFRWVDYSNTSVDPDGLTIWTVQPYAETRVSDSVWNEYATRVAQIVPY